MNRRDLFRFARRGDLFVPESANSPDIISADCKPRGRAQVGYSRRFFVGAMAAGVCAAVNVKRYQSLYDYVAGIDRSYGEDETVFARSVAPGNWRESSSGFCYYQLDGIANPITGWPQNTPIMAHPRT